VETVLRHPARLWPATWERRWLGRMAGPVAERSSTTGGRCQSRGSGPNTRSVSKHGFERSTLRGPDGNRRRTPPRNLHHRGGPAGMPSVCPLWASAGPNTWRPAENPKAALFALIRASRAWPEWARRARDLRGLGREYERKANAAGGEDPDVKQFVERLEQTMDEGRGGDAAGTLDSFQARLSDFQRFLRQRARSSRRLFQQGGQLGHRGRAPPS